MSGDLKAQGKEDSLEYRKLMLALSRLRFSTEEIDAIFSILASVLLLGNVDFVGTDKVRNGSSLINVGLLSMM